ncbi:MAG TPA: hypothetical protein VFP94_10810, partial [Terriglobales bacterium]|nr:hypothetical protein [Terriglobales bacterium]
MRIRRTLLCALLAALCAFSAAAQDQANIVITGTSKFNLAAPLFPAHGVAQDLQDTFNQVLWNDLYQSAVVTMVGRSLYTAAAPAGEADLNNPAYRQQWTAPPLNIQRLVFGDMQMAGGGLVVSGYLYDISQPPGAGRLLARRYANPATVAGARQIAHHLADDIVAALGFGPGIASSQIAFISNRSG